MAVDLDAEFREAVAAIDAGDAPSLSRMLAAKPHLLTARLDTPGAWLRDVVGDAVAPGGFFERPYLLWFVAEDPVRNGKLPANIADVARLIIQAAQQAPASSLPEQIEVALRLVCWSWIARQCNVQIPLIDVLLDAGASSDGRTTYGGRFGTHGDAAIHNGNLAAAEHLVQRGAPLTLTMALYLNRWNDVARLASSATPDEKRDAFVQAAMCGNAEALRRMLALGVDATTLSSRNQSHATALHHAVWSANLDAVRVLVEAGADTTRTDTIYNASPLGWAEYAESQQKDAARAARYREIAAYLREYLSETTRS